MSNQINHYEMANAIRALSIDAIETANSGHPGCLLGWLMSQQYYLVNS